MSDTHSHSHLWPGVPLALGSAPFFGATPPLSKLLLEEVNPFMLAGLLYLGAGFGLGIYSLIRGQKSQPGSPAHGQDIPWLALAIGMGGVMGLVLLMFGLTLTRPQTARCC